MKKRIRKGLVAATAAVAAIAALGAGTTLHSGSAVADSGPFSATVRRACKGDYNRFCPGYSLYGTELRRCMQAAGKAISKRCIHALVDAGEVPRSVLKGNY